MGRAKVSAAEKARSYPISLKPRAIANLLRIQQLRKRVDGVSDSLGDIVSGLVEVERARLETAALALPPDSAEPFASLISGASAAIARIFDLPSISFEYSSDDVATFRRRDAIVTVREADGMIFVSGRREGEPEVVIAPPIPLHLRNPIDVATVIANVLLDASAQGS